jgi:hypothetical protein
MVALAFFIMCLIIAEAWWTGAVRRTIPRRSYDAEMEPTLAIWVNPGLTAGGGSAVLIALRGPRAAGFAGTTGGGREQVSLRIAVHQNLTI